MNNVYLERFEKCVYIWFFKGIRIISNDSKKKTGSAWFFVDNMVEDMDVDLDKEFLQELKELKILITDKDLLDQHKR